MQFGRTLQAHWMREQNLLRVEEPRGLINWGDRQVGLPSLQRSGVAAGPPGPVTFGEQPYDERATAMVAPDSDPDGRRQLAVMSERK